MPFKTVPNIIRGRAKIQDLVGKEFIALYMMDYNLASEIDLYKFKIKPDIYLRLLYSGLRSMRAPIGWRWKKQDKTKIKATKYSKLYSDIKQQLSQEYMMSLHDIELYDEYFIDRIENDNEFKKKCVDIFISKNNIMETKKRDSLYKKYEIKIQQQTLF